MNPTKAKLAIAAFAATSLLFSTGCEKLKARDHLNKGVAAFKNSKFPDAVEHFKQAIELDPTWSNARLYLATAYMSQYIPGADSPENLANAKAAHDNFMMVLEQSPNDTIALASLASLHYSEAQGTPMLDDKLKKLDEARGWYEKLAQVDPENKEAFYSLGVITWAKWYPRLMEARAKLGMKPEDPGPIKDNKIRMQLKATYGPMIESGLKHLQRSIEIDPKYDDAMAYMNLLIRERADLAETPEQYKKDIETADDWVQKSLETKKIKAEEAAKKRS
jgi:tetratricopeptide (TPR) repeat protein